jgi:hypothetical protein
MAVVSPQTFFRFAADHYKLLVDLYPYRDGITEAELLRLIERHGSEELPAPFYVLKRLCELGFIDVAPLATAQYEMTRPFAELMSSLLREYRLTSVEVIRSYFTAMDHLAMEILQSSSNKDGDQMVRVLHELAEHIERMRHDSRRNHDGVIATALRIKSNKDRIAAKQRYEIINRLWSRYLVPLRDMIDVDKAMDASLERVEGALIGGAQTFQTDGAVAPVVLSAQARLLRMRRDVVQDFRESLREISPLYDELRRENALARGATFALESIGRTGLDKMDLSRLLGISSWQLQGAISDTALEAYLLSVRGYIPSRPAAIETGDHDMQARQYMAVEDFDTMVLAALPVKDAFSWLADNFPDEPLHLLLRFYGRMHTGIHGEIDFGVAESTYEIGETTIAAYPMHVKRREETIK